MTLKEFVEALRKAHEANPQEWVGTDRLDGPTSIRCVTGKGRGEKRCAAPEQAIGHPGVEVGMALPGDAGGNRCPISWLAGEHGHAGVTMVLPVDAGERLGLDEVDVGRIVLATEGAGQPRLRKQMLKILVRGNDQAGSVRGSPDRW